MARKALLGNKVRRLRRQNELTQVEMAHRLEISPSYLNLIEHNQRPLTLPLLLKLARIFDVDLQAFSEDDEARLMTALGEIFGDRLFAEHGVGQDDVRDLVGASPAACQAVLSLYGAYQTARDDVQALSERLSDDPLLSASSHELRTLLTSVRSFAEILHDNTDLRSGQRQRFIGILVEESRRLTAFVERVLDRAGGTTVTGLADLRAPTEEVGDLVEARGNHFPEIEDAAEALGATLAAEDGALLNSLRRHLAETHGVDVAITAADAALPAEDRSDPERRLELDETLAAETRAFRVARRIGLLDGAAAIQGILEQARFANPQSAALGQGVLASYFAGALLMPYPAFQEAARALRHDIHGLQRRFGVSFEQVCHRLATLQRPGAEGIPLHFLRVDIAGNVSKRFGGSGFRIPRYGGICPRWPVHMAFLTPGQITAQLSELPDGERFFNIACAITKPAPRHGQPASHFAIMIGCDAAHAPAFVYADGLDLGGSPAVAPVGTTCRLCDRTDCEQRAFPPLGHEPTAVPEARPASRIVSSALLPATLLGVAMAAAAQPPPDPISRLRTIMTAACAPDDVAATALAKRIGVAELMAEQLHLRGDTQLGWTRRYRLGDGAELALIRRGTAQRLVRFSGDYFEPDKEGTLRPIATATADRTCAIIQGRRIHYDAEGRQETLELFGPGLGTTGRVDPLNPPVPPGTDPGGVPVALFDSGLAYTLPDFAARLARDPKGKALGYDYWDLDHRPFDANPSRSAFFPIRHGTPVASVLLREAPKVRLIPYRFPRPDMSRMASMVSAADGQGVIVVSMPMGSRDPADWAAFEEAARARPHMLFVVSAGNDGRDIDRQPIYPAALDLENILVVTSATPFGRLAPGSNWGRETVDLMVPAERIEVIDYRGAAGKASGSSYAVPRVAALAARLLADNPDWKAPELKAAILKRAAPSPYEREGLVRHGWIANPAD